MYGGYLNFELLLSLQSILNVYECHWVCFFELAETIESKIQNSGLSIKELIMYFRNKCTICGHHRIMHNEFGKCEGVMNKPCMSGCDSFKAEWIILDFSQLWDA